MFTLSQGLDYLDNLEVSSDSEEESLGDLQSAKFYLQPPLNSNRSSCDVDSGDENTAAAGTSNLSGNQLLGKVKILRQKRLFKKQNGEKKAQMCMCTNGFIQTFHSQLVLNGPYLTQC